MTEDIIRKKNTTMTDAAREAANAYKRAWNVELSRQETAGKDVLTNGIDGKAD